MDENVKTLPIMKIILFIASAWMAVVLLTACNSDKTGSSPEVLHDTILVSMLADFFIAEGAMIQLEYIQQKEPDAGAPLYREIFKKHGTTREAFIHSLEYHAQQPAKLDRIYDLAIQQLQREQEAMTQKKAAEATVDSLKQKANQ